MSAIIYLLTNTLNGKQYVGLTTTQLKKRWQAHCYKANHGSRTYLHTAIRKYGSDSFIQNILEETTEELVHEREKYWIAQLAPDYNMTTGGEGTLGLSGEKNGMYGRCGTKHHRFGIPHTEETKQKISASQSGERGNNYGKKLSSETCAKMSASRRGEKHYNFGKKFSPELRAKLSEAAKRRHRKNRIQAPPATIFA